MLTDLLGDITVVRVRKDFGEFCSTIFDLLLKKNGCTLSDLNFFIPKQSYSLIRSALLNLFQHNLIYFSPEFLYKEKNLGFISGIKIFPCLHACLYRFRFFRFFSLMEHEYGKLGLWLTKKFYEKGQINIDISVENIFFKKSTILGENLLVLMARDGYITTKFASHGVSAHVKNEILYSNGKKKPSFYGKKIPWKLDMLKLNLGLKINIIFSILHQNLGELLYSTIRSCTSRIFSFKNQNFQKTWFNLDTLLDITVDTAKIPSKDEINLNTVLQNGLANNFSFIAQNTRIKIDYENIFSFFQTKTTENLVKNQFGKNFFHVFKILSNDVEMSDQKIAFDCYEEELLVRKEIFKMFRLGFLLVEEKTNTPKTQFFKKSFVCCVNINFVRKRLISEILKSMFNIFLRIHDFDSYFEKLKFFSEKDCDKNVLIKQKQALFLSITKLDEILNVLYS